MAPSLAAVLTQTPSPDSTSLEQVVPSGLGWEDWVQAGVVLVVAIGAAMVLRRLICRFIGADDAPMAARAVSRFSAALVVGVGFVYALNSLGVSIGPLLGVLGVGGIALAFALQDILENLISGLLLQARRPFTIGDEVITNDLEGTVSDVNLRSVVIDTFDGRRVIVPSSMVLKNPIENDTATPTRRTSVVVGIAYGADVDEALRVVCGALDGTDGVLDAPAPEAYLEAFGASSVDIVARFWHASDRRSMWEVRSAAIGSIKRALDDAGIEIPFPQRVLQVDRADAEDIGAT